MTGTMVPDPISVLADLPAPRDPYPHFARLRETSPVCWSDRIDSWVLTRYEDCAAVLRDSASFGSDWRRIGEAIPEPMLSIQSLDPPEHTGIRRLLVDAVRLIDYRALETTIAAEVRTRLARLCEQGPFDYITEFAAPLALKTITTVLGCPPIDPVWFFPLSQRIVDGMDAGIWPETGGPAVAAQAELADLTGTWLDRPRSDGLIGHVATVAATSGVARPVLLNSLRAVLHAGFESAGRLLGIGLDALLATPTALEELTKSDPGPAIEEIVRFAAPVQGDGRACVAQTRFGDHVIAPGDAVTILFGAANRDPARFTRPDALDFTRHPNPHLGFGRGAHSCLGQPLAVLQARIVFTTIAEEYPHVRAVREPVYRRNLTLRGIANYEIRLN
ncbi:MAG TPA: cytochrome P450 [Streptosporangiaceae bacterium]|nr:cytochrome P450 [Streptosporangiaceae bacterium]